MHRLWINLWTSGAHFFECALNTAEGERVFVQKSFEALFREHYLFRWKGPLWMICGETVDNSHALLSERLNWLFSKEDVAGTDGFICVVRPSWAWPWTLKAFQMKQVTPVRVGVTCLKTTFPCWHPLEAESGLR